ncbi:radical SAM protein, partial [Candidatus Bathyarchaeota archaeon]
MWLIKPRAKPVQCLLCGKESPYISESLNLCINCIREKPEKAEPLILEAHRKSREKYGLPKLPPKTEGGIPCNLCSNECILGEGETGYCGLRINVKGKLSSLCSPEKGLFHAYKDPHITNCLGPDSII